MATALACPVISAKKMQCLECLGTENLFKMRCVGRSLAVAGERAEIMMCRLRRGRLPSFRNGENHLPKHQCSRK